MSAGGRGRVVPLGAGPERAASLAIEPRYRLLYWSCSSEGTINATRLDNGSTPILVVRSHHSEKPKHIAIHSSEGLLFWLSVGRDNRIYRARLDGGAKTTLVSGLVPYVTSLAIDAPSSILYWMTQSSIESIDFNGKSRREVVRDNLSKVGNLAVSGGSVLWVQGSRLISHNLATGRSRVAFSAHYPNTALAYVSSSHPRSDTRTCLGNDRVDSPLECPDTGSSGFCDSNHYSCRGTEGECIPIEWRCDGVIDCLNSADEASCPPCPEGKFTCLQGQCIDLRWVCDGTPNCLDHSDERDCCSGHECGGHCLPPEVICDGWQNCADGSDEAPSACAKRQAPTITASVPQSSNYLIFGVLVGFSIITAGFAFYKCQNSSGKCCSKKPVGGVMDPALDPLSPNGYRSVGLGSSLRMSTLGGTSSSGAATLCYPANPPPSPATTQRCMIYRPPPPTPCSTDQAHDTDSNYQGDMMEPLPPPPTPTSLSPSSSTYFHPVPPPPSPTP